MPAEWLTWPHLDTVLLGRCTANQLGGRSKLWHRQPLPELLRPPKQEGHGAPSELCEWKTKAANVEQQRNVEEFSGYNGKAVLCRWWGPLDGFPVAMSVWRRCSRAVVCWFATATKCESLAPCLAAGAFLAFPPCTFALLLLLRGSHSHEILTASATATATAALCFLWCCAAVVRGRRGYPYYCLIPRCCCTPPPHYKEVAVIVAGGRRGRRRGGGGGGGDPAGGRWQQSSSATAHPSALSSSWAALHLSHLSGGSLLVSSREATGRGWQLKPLQLQYAKGPREGGGERACSNEFGELSGL